MKRFKLLGTACLLLASLGCSATNTTLPVSQTPFPPAVVSEKIGPELAKVEVPTDDWVRHDVPSSPKQPAQTVFPKTPKQLLAEGEAGPKKEEKRKKARNGDLKEVKREYAELIKKPELLGFVPTDNLYRNIYYNIKQWFVEDVGDDQLLVGVKKEVKNYLEQVKVDPSALKSIDKDTRVIEAYKKIMDLYGEKTDKNILGYVALLGLLDGCKDAYSVLMTPTEYGKLEEQLQSKSFGGIGIYIELDREHGNQLMVVEPIEGTPAYNAGVEAGDKIMQIDGKPTKGVTLDLAQGQIRGEIGTPVVLTVDRQGQTKEITVKRDKIHVVSVNAKMYPGNVGYVRMRTFGQDTAAELETAIKKLKGDGAKALILDLRNNGGGYIDAAVNVVGQFTPANSLVVFTVDRGKKRKEYRSTIGGGVGIPVVCMINEFSASASEITAGALLDLKVATLVGDHSFGKGSVQQLLRPDVTSRGEGPRLKLTIARFYTPSGTVIDHQGIEPQVQLEMEPRFVGKAAQDVQLKKALELLGGNIQ